MVEATQADATSVPSAELLRRAAEAADALPLPDTSSHSQRSYQCGLRYWCAWHYGRYRASLTLPVPEEVVLQFIYDHVLLHGLAGAPSMSAALVDALIAAGVKKNQKLPSYGTLQLRLFALSVVHQEKNLSNPCQLKSVRDLMQSAKMSPTCSQTPPVTATAITRTMLEAMLQTCDASPVGLRDAALLWFAFVTGGRKSGQVTDADARDLDRAARDEYVFRTAHADAEQIGDQLHSPSRRVMGRAATALSAWLEWSGITEGPLFRRLYRGGRLGGGLSITMVSRIVAKRAAQAGLVGHFTGHSLRLGFIIDGVAHGVSLVSLMVLTGYHSLTPLYKCIEANPDTPNSSEQVYSRSSRRRKPV